jgi:hypothetical protein
MGKNSSLGELDSLALDLYNQHAEVKVSSVGAIKVKDALRIFLQEIDRLRKELEKLHAGGI